MQKRVAVIKNLARQRRPTIYIDTLKGRARNMQNCRSLFEIFSVQFKPQLNKSILSLQYCKLIRLSDETVDKLVVRLRIKAVE